MSETRRLRFVETTLFTIAPVLAWAGQFGAVYGYQHVACYRPDALPLGWITPVTVGVTIVALAFTGYSAFAARRVLMRGATDPPSAEARTFLVSFLRLIAILSATAIIFTGITVFVLPACPELR